MRRIIERVVTVVTTTTWKISWEPDTHQTDPQTDSASNEFLLSDGAIAQTTVTETKEVHQKSIESEPTPKVDEPLHLSSSPKKERKSKP